ncbi:protein PTST, chloroplastic isoform X2 [Juglans microcarpa x Juglans regia]|uniref:protein PTST, chloroplastic isoform X2 n=1 Tax=Juglans microcarpa x Juglans regia TaxID=2249226 RepID=UPI001B7F429A|nr:protein PTST, chloroplastic isoform X2 [Juglans microcarpa x Juglans regia]
MDLGTARHCLDKHVTWFLRNSRTSGGENIHKLPYNVAGWNLRMGYQRLTYTHQSSTGKHPMARMSWRRYSMSVSLEESSSLKSDDYSSSDDAIEMPEEVLAQPLGSDELYIKEDALVNFKSELAVMELEIQALVTLAEEIAKSSIPAGSRKINGRYIQSHLLSRLEAVREKLKEQIKDVDGAQSKEVSLFWCGMAESVQVMGTFDGWSQGEDLSPEYTGSFTKFSATLMLRPGRYEIKFLVDGEWHLSPEYPTVGEGLMKNNLLIVE